MQSPFNVKPDFHLRIFSREANFSFVFIQLVPVERPKTNEKFASREKIRKWKTGIKGPYRPNAIWQRDANFQFSMTFNFNIFQCFSNIRNHLSNFSYLVCISCKIFIR